MNSSPMEAVAIAQECQAHACCKSAHRQRYPRKHGGPAKSALKRPTQQNGHGDCARKYDRPFKSPASSRRQGHEQIQKPEGWRRARQQQENRYGRKIGC